MSDLIEARAPLYGRAGAVDVPAPLDGAELAELWQARDPTSALLIDAALGGLPGYRPLVEPPGRKREAWMVEEVLAPSSPLLDAAEADLAGVPDPPALRGAYRAILAALAAGERTFSAISRVAGLPSGALSRPLAALQRAGLVERIPDPPRPRRSRYDLADPYLRLWLAIIAPNRTLLQAGGAAEVWSRVGETTWPSQVLGPRWEGVARAHLATAAKRLEPVDMVGTTGVADPARKQSQEVDFLAISEGKVVALGEARLRTLGPADLERLLRIRDLLSAPKAKIVLASATGVDSEAAGRPDMIAIEPENVYD